MEQETKKYLIIVNGQQQGPFTIDALRSQHISPNTFVWTYGMSNWMPASQVSELQSLFVTQPVNRPQYQPTSYPGGMSYQQTVFQRPVQPSYQQPTNVSGAPYQQTPPQPPILPQSQPTENPGSVPYQQTIPQQPQTEDNYDLEDDEEGPSTFKIVCVIIGIALILFAILDLALNITNISRFTKYISMLGGAIIYLGLKGEEG